MEIIIIILIFFIPLILDFNDALNLSCILLILYVIISIGVTGSMEGEYVLYEEKELYPLVINGAVTDDYCRAESDGILVNLGSTQEVVRQMEIVYGDENKIVRSGYIFDEKKFPNNILINIFTIESTVLHLKEFSPEE